MIAKRRINPGSVLLTILTIILGPDVTSDAKRSG